MELWEPWLNLIGGFLLVVGIVSVTFKMTVNSRLKRSMLRITGTLLSLPFAGFSLLALLTIGCERQHGPLIGSPDRHHVARVQVSGGSAIDHPYGEVILRRSWQPTWTVAYFGVGYYAQEGAMTPKVRWLDDSHLLIKFPSSDEDRFVVCLGQIGKINVKCEAEKVRRDGTEE
jgi:hypothetical protein